MILVTIKEAAERLSVSQKTVYRLINWKKLNRVKIGGATRISEDELNEYMEQQFRKGKAHVQTGN
jgi:excisionase family DNA binding protein